MLSYQDGDDRRGENMVSSSRATNRRRGGANQKGNRGSALRVRRALEEEARALAKEESRQPIGDAMAR